MKKLKIPFEKIGQDGWEKKAQSFFEKYDIETLPLDESALTSAEKKLGLVLPQSLKEFYAAFGGTVRKDLEFTCHLYEPAQFMPLDEAAWSFVRENFPKEETENFIVIGESPARDPVVIEKGTAEIFLFSHDPVSKCKMYDDFDQLVKDNMINIQIQLDDLDIDRDQEIKLKAELLGGKNIDSEMRYIKLGSWTLNLAYTEIYNRGI